MSWSNDINKPLSPQMQAAVDYWLSHIPCTYTAAYRHGYPNVDPSIAHKAGSELFKNPRVKKYIQEKRAEQAEQLNIDATKVLEELARMGFAPKGDQDYTAQVKLKALDLIQKQLGLQTKNVNADVNAAVVINEDIPKQE